MSRRSGAPIGIDAAIAAAAMAAAELRPTPEAQRGRLGAKRKRGAAIFGRPHPGRPEAVGPAHDLGGRVPLVDILDKAAERRIREYCSEEVWRQGHDTLTDEGVRRVRWMTAAWARAVRDDRDGTAPGTGEIEYLGTVVEPGPNEKGFREGPVRVGGEIRAGGRDRITAAVKKLTAEWKKAEGDDVEALVWYYRFELIHPFADGNGRTGKILLNRLLGRLADPVFPVNDIFGHAIRNP